MITTIELPSDSILVENLKTMLQARQFQVFLSERAYQQLSLRTQTNHVAVQLLVLLVEEGETQDIQSAPGPVFPHTLLPS